MAQKITALDSLDPKARFTAVKEIARNKDVTMLDKLVELAENDPNDQVRQVAAKAVAYIKGEAKAGTRSVRNAQISERDRERARQIVDSALSYQIDGDNERALKELGKAVNLDPNLERDPFFKSVLGEVADGDDDAALALLADKSQSLGRHRRPGRHRLAHSHAQDRSPRAEAGLTARFAQFSLARSCWRNTSMETSLPSTAMCQKDQPLQLGAP